MGRNYKQWLGWVLEDAKVEWKYEKKKNKENVDSKRVIFRETSQATSNNVVVKNKSMTIFHAAHSSP